MADYAEPIGIRSKKFSVSIIKYCLHLKRKGIDYSIRDQLLRSGTSIGANIIEGRSSSSRIQLARYYEIALRSADETRYWLEIIAMSYALPEEEVLVNELDQLIRILASIIKKLKNNPGSNY
jgi:four helix bundle protein